MPMDATTPRGYRRASFAYPGDNKRARVATLDAAGDAVVFRAVTLVVCTGVKPVFRLTTREGRTSGDPQRAVGTGAAILDP